MYLYLNNFRKFSTSAISRNLKPLKISVGTSQKGTNVLSVKWNTDKEVAYPAVWLRDNCQCPKCYQKTAMARLSLMRNLNVDIDISRAEIINPDQVNGQNCENETIYNFHFQIKIQWEDGHESHFNAKFLAKYGPQGTSADHFGHSGESRNLHLWNSHYQIERFDFENIKVDQETLYNWLHGKTKLVTNFAPKI